MSDSSAQAVRQLKIKTGVVRRLFKEETSYESEVTANRARLDKLRTEGADGADIRNAERVVADSEQMVPRTRRALEEAVVVLDDLLDGLKPDADVAASAEYTDAFSLVQQVQAAWKADGN
ncbi:hypothetical protein Q5752_002501 [Cryptotrichosporon argae]